MFERGYESPEQAAMVGFSAAHCRVVAALSCVDDAYVLLETGESEQPYL